MPVVRIPLVGVIHAREAGGSNETPSVSSTDQRFINVFFRKDKNPITGAERIRVCKRAGFNSSAGSSVNATVGGALAVGQSKVTINGLSAFSIWGAPTSTNNFFVMLGNTQSANVSMSAVLEAASRPYLLNVDGTPQFYFHINTVGSSNKGAFVSTTANPPVVSAQTDADLPETDLIGSFAAIDGYLFIASESGGIFNSELNNDTSWTATSFIEPHFQNYSRGVFNYKDKIGLFTEDTIEFYENVGNPTGSPLQRVDHLTQRSFGLQLGIGDDTTDIDTSQFYLSALDTVFWVNNSRVGQNGIFMLDGFKPVKISDATVDLELALDGAYDARISGVFHHWGLTYLSVEISNSWWLYCFELGAWLLWSSTLGVPVGILNSKNSTGSESEGVFAFIGNAFYRMDDDSGATLISYTDAGEAYTTTIQTRVLDFGTNLRKRFKSVTLVGSDSRETSTCTVSRSVDDGETFAAATQRTIDLNSLEDRRLYRQGVARRIQWKITNASDAACDLEALDVDYEEMEQ